MITRNDLLEVIAECEGEKNPTPETCKRLASYYILLERIDKQTDDSRLNFKAEYSSNYSESKQLPENHTYSNTDSALAIAIREKGEDEIFQLFEEILATLEQICPKLYQSIQERLH